MYNFPTGFTVFHLKWFSFNKKIIEIFVYPFDYKYEKLISLFT